MHVTNVIGSVKQASGITENLRGTAATEALLVAKQTGRGRESRRIERVNFPSQRLSYSPPPHPYNCCYSAQVVRVLVVTLAVNSRASRR